MEASLQKTTSVLLGLGSILFLIAAFLPYSRVFIEPDPDKKMTIITSMNRMWNVGHVFFSSGALLTVVALGILSYGFRNTKGVNWSYIGVALLFIGAVLWSWHVAERISNPEGFARGTNTPYLFVIYSVLTQIGLIFVGILLLNTFLANWVGWMFIIGGTLLFILMVIFRDMPPFAYYMITVITAVVLFVNAK